MEENYHIDKIDKQILSILMENAKTPYTEIAKKLLVSPGTIHVRMKKMEDVGLVKKSQLTINHELLGYDLTAFLGIYLEKGSNYKDVIEQMEKIPEIVEAHYTTGVYSIFAKITCKNTKHMRHVLNEEIQSVSGIQRTETIISLEQSIEKQLQL
ncbi:MAG: Lrp/AsnC ligand binding domain-containing protein [Flavobacteriales bacterium]|jgi:Lrp/AsnC family transcriptional regulator for asnA, asnC and gidA|nr:Lrp/AsnC ligand binding domain-containing protein [Flavobacteriales bacterium]MDG1396636.1 Lrp/AsnC ligand binding domain-containing protein [Flavobacteriales bacterium]|tara:strand:- start:5445 stop:5906 length:462 start_codon:yes stop_codon:yes gene_type:complete